MKYLQSSYSGFINGFTNINLWPRVLLLALCCVLSIFILAILQLILHETGHYLFGLFTGYRFLSIRIFNLTVIKESGRYRIKRYSFPGSVGQCLMQPPEYENVFPHYSLYIMGGVILNTASAILFFILVISPFEISFTGRIILFLGAFYGFGFAALNGIPNRDNRIDNDGTNYKNLKKDWQAMQCYFTQLTILPKLQEGYTYRDFQEEIFKVPKKADLTNGLIGWHKILECYYYMDLRQWDKVEDCILEFSPVMDKVSRMLKNTVQMELLFINIIKGKNPTEIKDLYDKTGKLLYSPAADFHLIRVRMAYEINQNNTAAIREEIRKELIKLIRSYPFRGDALFCKGLLEELLWMQ